MKQVDDTTSQTWKNIGDETDLILISYIIYLKTLDA